MTGKIFRLHYDDNLTIFSCMHVSLWYSICAFICVHVYIRTYIYLLQRKNGEQNLSVLLKASLLVSIFPRTNSLLYECSPNAPEQSVQHLDTNNTVSDCILQVFYPEFVICPRSPLISQNRKLFGRNNGGGRTTLEPI